MRTGEMMMGRNLEVKVEKASVEPVIEKGCGISFKLYGHEGEFKLALAKVEEWYGQKMRLVFYNPTENKIIDSSLYSGGLTGFGEYENEIRDLDTSKYEIITTNLEDIENYLRAEEERKRREREEFIKKQLEKVEKINKLPKVFPLLTIEDEKNGKLEIYAERTEATFNPKWSRKINVGVYCKYKINDEESGNIWIHDYISTDGKILEKSFRKWNGYGKFGEFIKNENFNFKNLVRKFLEVEQQIKQIIRGY